MLSGIMGSTGILIAFFCPLTLSGAYALKQLEPSIPAFSYLMNLPSGWSNRRFFCDEKNGEDSSWLASPPYNVTLIKCKGFKRQRWNGFHCISSKMGNNKFIISCVGRWSCVCEWVKDTLFEWVRDSVSKCKRVLNCDFVPVLLYNSESWMWMNKLWKTWRHSRGVSAVMEEYH